MQGGLASGGPGVSVFIGAGLALFLVCCQVGVADGVDQLPGGVGGVLGGGRGVMCLVCLVFLVGELAQPVWHLVGCGHSRPGWSY